MPLFLFHLVRPDGISPDEIGNEFPSAEAAFLAAYDTALEMSFEMLRDRKDPVEYRFEIADPNGTILFDLPFSEALRSTYPRNRSGELATTLSALRIARSASNRNSARNTPGRDRC